jgi:hypothetical protein
VRAANVAKTLATVAQSKASSDRRFAQRDALQEAQKRDVAEMKFKFELSAHMKKIALHVALCEALRHRLGLAHAQQKVQELKILKLTKTIALLRACSRDEIYYERAHSARLKLWVHTMVAGFVRIKSMLRHRETLLHRQKALDLEARRSLRHEIWRQQNATQALGLDTSALFLFFAQRVAVMSGAHKSYNDALRANGATLVLAAMCRSPRRELRCLGAKALSALTWNSHVNSRLLGFQVLEQWERWVDVAVNRARNQRTNVKLKATGTHPQHNVTEFFVQTPHDVTTPYDIAVARRQWALRRQRTLAGPNLANISKLVNYRRAASCGDMTSLSPLIKILMVFCRDRDHECVIAAISCIVALSFVAENATLLGKVQGLVAMVSSLMYHVNPEVVILACHAAANMAFQQQCNQERLGAAGTIECLATILRVSWESATHEELIDIIEAATCALTNLLSLHAPNSRKFVATGGVELLLKFLNINSSNLLDADKATQMQTNVINVLANTLAAAGGKNLYLEDSFLHNTSSLFVSASRGMRSFAGTSVSDERSFAYSIVMLCTANNSPARQAAALLLGNLACSSRLRIELGRLGAVEALWRITRERKSSADCATALWALSNLVWSNRANQSRCGPLFEEIFEMIANCRIELPFKYPHLEPSCVFQTRHEDAWNQSAPASLECAYAMSLVANAIYFHDSNCNHMEVIPGGVEAIIRLSKADQPLAIREPALRCLACLTVSDRGAKRVALAESRDDAFKVMVNAAGDANVGSEHASVRRLGAAALASMNSIASARRYLRAAGGIDALVALAGTGEAGMSRQAHRTLSSFENISNQAGSGEIASLLRAVVHER